MTGTDSATCATCGASVGGVYCSNCGERTLVHEELTLQAQVRQVANALVKYDGKTLRTLSLLALRPGFLAFEYCRGARIRYLKPVQLFLLANVIYFMTPPDAGVASLRATLEVELGQRIYAEHLDATLRQHLEASGATSADYAERFAANLERSARALLALLVPAVTAVLALLDVRRTRTLIEHLVLAANYVAFTVVYAYVAVPVALRALSPQPDSPGLAVATTVITEAWMLAWWLFAFRRFHGWSWLRCSLHSVAMAYAVFPLVIGYRYLLFWVTYWTT